MKKRINKVTFYTVGICYIAVLVIALILAVSENKAQAQDTEPTETTEAEVYNIPLDKELLDHIQGLCADYVIPVELVLAMIEVESTYKADAVSSEGAIGLMQVIPECHEPRMMKLNCPDLFDPYQNVTVGMNYLAELIDKYDGNIHKALTAYHHGPTGAKDKFFGQGTYQSEYSLKVLETTEKIEEGMTEMPGIYFTDDPVKDHDRYQEEKDNQLQKLPKCSYCDEHIQDEHFYEINDEVICEECLKDNFRKSVDDYVS